MTRLFVCVWHLFLHLTPFILTGSQCFVRLFDERTLRYPLKNAMSMNIYSAVRAIVGVSLWECTKHINALVTKWSFWIFHKMVHTVTLSLEWGGVSSVGVVTRPPGRATIRFRQEHYIFLFFASGPTGSGTYLNSSGYRFRAVNWPDRLTM
jgi:hypothetical protein